MELFIHMNWNTEMDKPFTYHEGKMITLREYVLLEKIKDEFEVLPTNRNDVEVFVKKHYLKSFPTGIKKIYGIYQKSTKQMVGMIIYGTPFHTASKFLEPIVKPNEVLELKRLFIDDIGIKNLESFVIGQSLNLLRKEDPSIKVVLTFADDMQGHKGIIYQATNAIYLGKSDSGKHKYAYIINGDVKGIKNSLQPQEYPKKPINEANKYNQHLQAKQYQKKVDLLNQLKSNSSSTNTDIIAAVLQHLNQNPSTFANKMPSHAEWKRMSKEDRLNLIRRGELEHEWKAMTEKERIQRLIRLKRKQDAIKNGTYDPNDTELWGSNTSSEKEDEWDKWDRENPKTKTIFKDLPSQQTSNTQKPAMPKRKYPLDMYSYDDGSTDYRLTIPTKLNVKKRKN